MPSVKFYPEVTTGPTSEPVTIAEAKAHLSIAESDTTHDGKLRALIMAARDQWENDTDSITCYQSFRLRTNYVHDRLRLPKTPIQSITSIQYYDGNNSLQTLSASLYQLHVNEIRYGYQVTLPAYADRWDAWTITYRCGYSQDGRLVPSIAKQAMLLLVAFYFENPDMLMSEALQSMRPYNALVTRFQRSTYP